MSLLHNDDQERITSFFKPQKAKRSNSKQNIKPSPTPAPAPAKSQSKSATTASITAGLLEDWTTHVQPHLKSSKDEKKSYTNALTDNGAPQCHAWLTLTRNRYNPPRVGQLAKYEGRLKAWMEQVREKLGDDDKIISKVFFIFYFYFYFYLYIFFGARCCPKNISSVNK
jgi:hypothetical protein